MSIGLAAAAIAIGLAALTAPANSRHHPAPATTTTSIDLGTGGRLAYPAAVILPDGLAQAIGERRTLAEGSCPSGRATSWADVDEGGNVAGIETACTDGP